MCQRGTSQRTRHAAISALRHPNAYRRRRPRRACTLAVQPWTFSADVVCMRFYPAARARAWVHHSVSVCPSLPLAPAARARAKGPLTTKKKEREKKKKNRVARGGRGFRAQDVASSDVRTRARSDVDASGREVPLSALVGSSTRACCVPPNADPFFFPSPRTRAISSSAVGAPRVCRCALSLRVFRVRVCLPLSLSVSVCA